MPPSLHDAALALALRGSSAHPPSRLGSKIAAASITQKSTYSTIGTTACLSTALRVAATDPTAGGGAAAGSTSLGWGREGRSERGVSRQECLGSSGASAHGACGGLLQYTHIHAYIYKYICIYVSRGLLRRQQHPFIRASKSVCWHVGAGACVCVRACVYTCVCVRVSACPRPLPHPPSLPALGGMPVAGFLFVCFLALAFGLLRRQRLIGMTCEFSTMSNDPTGSENGCPCPTVGWYLRVPG
jgi:hypothetical protein